MNLQSREGGCGAPSGAHWGWDHLVRGPVSGLVPSSHSGSLGTPASQERGPVTLWDPNLESGAAVFFARRRQTCDPQLQPPGHGGGLTLPGHSKGNSPKPSRNLATRIRSSAGASRAWRATRRGGASRPSPVLIGWGAGQRAGSHAEPRLRILSAAVGSRRCGEEGGPRGGGEGSVLAEVSGARGLAARTGRCGGRAFGHPRG